MQEKIVEILIYLIGELQKNTPLGEIDLTVLTKNGYTASEISTAFTWLSDKISGGENIVSQTAARSPHSHRILHEAERLVISPEAYGYFIQLRELGLINDLDIELMIERIMMGGSVYVGFEDAKAFAAAIVLENDDSQNSVSRKMLHGKDTIH